MRILNIEPDRFRNIWRLAIPIIMGAITIMVMNQTDRIMIGRWDENLAGAALSATTQIQMLILIMSLILGSSMTVALQAICARRKGEGNLIEAGETFQTGVLISFILGLISGLIIYAFHEYLFILLIGSRSPVLINLGLPYFRWRCFELFFSIPMFAYRGFFNGIGQTKAPMYFTIVRVSLNIFFNALLIYGLWGFPELGVEGAGIGTLLATLISFLAFSTYIFLAKAKKKYQYNRISNPLKLSRIWRILRLSFPGALQYSAMFGIVVFNAVIISEYGEIMGGASSMIFAISNITFMFILGLGISGTTLVGQSLGRKMPKLAETYAYDIAKIGMFVMAVFSLIIFAFPELFLRMYTNNESIISVGVLPLRIFVTMQVFNAAGVIFSKCLQGAGAQKHVTAFEYIAQFWQVSAVLVLGLIFNVPFWMLWLGFISYQLLMFMLNFCFFRSRKWQSLKV